MNSAGKRACVAALLMGGVMVMSKVQAEEAGQGAVPAEAGQSVPTPEQDAAPGPASAPSVQHFDLMEIQVEGNTVLSLRDIEQAIYPYVGEKKTIDDVEAARQHLEEVYHKAGYQTVFVDIPEQKVTGGLVKLHVTEGGVGRLRVTGSQYHSLQRIKDAVPELAEGRVPNFPEMQKGLAQLNRGRDRAVTPVLKASQTPGKVDVELKVKDSLPLHGSVEFNNLNSVNTTRPRLVSQLRYENLWQKDHSVSLQYQTSPEDSSQVNAYVYSYLAPFPESGRTLLFYGVHSDSNVAALGSLNVIGKGDIYGLRGILPLPAGKDYFHTLTLGIDYKDFNQTLALSDTSAVYTPIHYVPLSAQYDLNLPDDSGNTRFAAGVTAGVRGALSSGDQTFDDKRFKARGSFIYFRGEAERLQKLPWGMSLQGKFTGQLANQPLVNNEQFTAGGNETVRGYFESELLGDDGAFGRLELRSPSFSQYLSSRIDQWVLAAFLEGAVLRTQEALPGQRSVMSLSSTGLRTQLKLFRHLSAVADIAWPFQTAAVTRKGDPRIDFRIGYEF